MEHILVDSERLNALAEDLKLRSENLSRNAEMLFGEITALSDAWEGPSQAAFTESFAKEFEQLQNSIAYVRRFSSLLTEASLEYRRCEQWVSDAVDSIQVI